jgi:hypothetical protein
MFSMTVADIRRELAPIFKQRIEDMNRGMLGNRINTNGAVRFMMLNRLKVDDDFVYQDGKPIISVEYGFSQKTGKATMPKLTKMPDWSDV